jgi:hypothetical protein
MLSKKMYNSHYFKEEIAIEDYPKRAKQLAKLHGLFQIFDFDAPYIEEFINHEIIAYDTRKIDLGQLIDGVVEVLSEWHHLNKSLQKALPFDLHLKNKILYKLGGMSNHVFTAEVDDYKNYLIKTIQEIWSVSLTLDFGKLEQLNPNELNYAQLILNEDKNQVSFKTKNPYSVKLFDLALHRIAFIRQCKPIETSKEPKKYNKKPKNDTPSFADFLQKISFEQLKSAFIFHKICDINGKFITQVGGRNPFPSPILIAYLPQILNELGLFDISKWEQQQHIDKIQILSDTFGVKNNASFISNASSKIKRPSDMKIFQFNHVIKNALKAYSDNDFDLK